MPARRFFKTSRALLILILSVAFPLKTMSICLHGTGVSVAAFGTNALGQMVQGKAHPGATVGVLIRVNMNDDCPGDNTLVTNVTDVVDAQCVSFTTSNLLSEPLLLSFFGQSHSVSNTPEGFAYKYIVPDCGSNTFIYHETKAFSLDSNSTTHLGGPLFAGGSLRLQILRSKLDISERRYSTVGQDEMQWEAGLTNTGDTTLTNVSVRYFTTGTNHLVWGPGELAAGQGTIIRSAPSIYDCAEDPGMLIAQGTDELFFQVSSTNQTAMLPSQLSVQYHRQPEANSDILLRWPARFSCFSLEKTATLTAMDWLPVQASQVLTNGEVIVALPATNQAGFFRLIRR